MRSFTGKLARCRRVDGVFGVAGTVEDLVVLVVARGAAASQSVLFLANIVDVCWFCNCSRRADDVQYLPQFLHG